MTGLWIPQSVVAEETMSTGLYADPAIPRFTRAELVNEMDARFGFTDGTFRKYQELGLVSAPSPDQRWTGGRAGSGACLWSDHDRGMLIAILNLRERQRLEIGGHLDLSKLGNFVVWSWAYSDGYAGRSQGFSIPVGSVGGRSVRYRLGANKGHFVQGELHPAAVDQGKLGITNQRVLFVGAKKTIECLFAKLVGAEVSGGELALSVSNRQKVTRVHYGANLDGWVQMRLTLAMSIARGDSDQFAAQIQEQLTEPEAKRPQPVTT